VALNAQGFRRIALSMPEASEGSHLGHPDFRVRGKIFATLGFPNDTRAMVKLLPEQQAEFVHDYPEVFSPASGKWGLNGATSIHLPKTRKAELSRAVEAAWRNALSAPPTRSKRKTTKR